MSATLSISRTEAETLLGWVGNSAQVASDVDLYDGGSDYEGNDLFGFYADVTPTKDEVAQSLINAALIIVTPESGSFVKFLAEGTRSVEVAGRTSVKDSHAATTAVVWNVLLTD